MNEDLPKKEQNRLIQELFNHAKEDTYWKDSIINMITHFRKDIIIWINHKTKQKFTTKNIFGGYSKQWFGRKLTEELFPLKAWNHQTDSKLTRLEKWEYWQLRAMIEMQKIGMIRMVDQKKNPANKKRTLSAYALFNGFNFIKLRKQCTDKYNKPRDA